MKQTTIIATALKRACCVVGSRGLPMLMAATIFLLLAGMSLLRTGFYRGVQAMGEKDSAAPRTMVPPGTTPLGQVPQKTLANMSTIDVSYASSDCGGPIVTHLAPPRVVVVRPQAPRIVVVRPEHRDEDEDEDEHEQVQEHDDDGSDAQQAPEHEDDGSDAQQAPASDDDGGDD